MKKRFNCSAKNLIDKFKITYILFPLLNIL